MKNPQVKEARDVIVWNNLTRYTLSCDMPPNLQEFGKDHIAANVPRNRPAQVWFDVYDLEEQRI